VEKFSAEAQNFQPSDRRVRERMMFLQNGIFLYFSTAYGPLQEETEIRFRKLFYPDFW